MKNRLQITTQQRDECTEWKCQCGHCFNLQLLHLLNEVHLLGWSDEVMDVVYRRAVEQKEQGDEEYNRFPALHTILQRVLKGEYDYLFSN